MQKPKKIDHFFLDKQSHSTETTEKIKSILMKNTTGDIYIQTKKNTAN